MEGKSIDFHRAEAASSAERAVSFDKQGDNFMAAQFYENASEHLLQVIEISASDMMPSDKKVIEDKAGQYKRRAESLRTKMLADDLPCIPTEERTENFSADKNSLQSVDSNPTISSKLEAGIGSIDALQKASEALNTAYNAVQKAKKLDEEYSISTRLCSAAQQVGTTAVAAVKSAEAIEHEYHVSEKVTESVKSGIATANKLEEDYHLSQRAAAAVSEAARLAAEAQQRYHLRQRLEAMVEVSWETLKAAGEEAYEYDQRHRLSQRAAAAAADAIASAGSWARQAMASTSSSSFSFSSSFSSYPSWWAGAPTAPAAPRLPPNAEV